MDKVLVIAVHPDDETLGCGGTLLKHIDSGDQINLLIMTDILNEFGFDYKTIEKRKREIEEIVEKYGFNSVDNLKYPTMNLDKYDMSEIIKKIAIVINKIQPNIMYVPFYNDAHSDHRITFNALIPFFKSFRYPYIKRVLMMEVLSETEHSYPVHEHIFKPNYFVDISKYLEKKMEILKVYESELGIAPFPRSIDIVRSMSALRGSMINCKYAEAFSLIKEIR